MIRMPYRPWPLIITILISTMPTLHGANAASPKRAMLQGEFHETVHEDVARMDKDVTHEGTSSSSQLLAGLISNGSNKIATMAGAITGSASEHTTSADNLSRDIRIADIVIVGATAGRISGEDLRHLAVTSSLGAIASNVCLTVGSRDSVYWASNEYILPDNASAGELVLLPYDKSRRLSFLKKFDHSQIAVKVIKGGCASSGGSAYLVVRQGGQKLPSEVRLYVNSLGATDVHASFSGETPRPCRAVKGRRTFFDHECELEWPRDKLNTKAEVVVEREMHGRKLPRASMNVEYVFKP